MKNLNKILKLTPISSAIFMVSCSSQCGTQNSTAVFSKPTIQKIIVSGNRFSAQTMEIALLFLALPVAKASIMPESDLKLDANIVDLVVDIPSSTFGVDVDTSASFNEPKIIRHGYDCQKDAIRFEELVEKSLFLLSECLNKSGRIAKENTIKKVTNRMLKMTDADFNDAIGDFYWLLPLAENKGKQSIFLEPLKYGTDDYKDYLRGQYVDKGFGMWSHDDSISKKARELLAFNPSLANEYRLSGDEKRTFDAQYFNTDKIDSGEFNVGHNALSLYEKPSPNWSCKRFLRGQSSVRKAYLKKDFDKHNDECRWLGLPNKNVSCEQSELRTEIPKLTEFKDAGRSNRRLRFISNLAAFVKSLGKARHIEHSASNQMISWMGKSPRVDLLARKSKFVQLVNMAQEFSG